jgi:histidinol-phosphate aminotransferase
MMLRIPDYVASLKPYVPGKPIEELERELGISGSVKLASNENPVGPSKKALKALRGNVLGNLNRYPDGGAYYLRQALSRHLGVREEELIVGNGSNELLDIAVRTFMKPGDEAVMAWPSFIVYPMAVQAQGCTGVKVPLSGFRHDLDAMADAVTERTRMLFIANPNNPTGTVNTAGEVDRLMERLPTDIIVVVDEAYYEYVADPSYADSMKHFRDGRNVLILRTFSKIYGLAGLRIGYGISKPGILEEMNKIREPFNTSTPAQAAAIAALEDREHVERSKSINLEGRQYLCGELESLGVKYVPTEANFIFMFPGKDSEEVFQSLLRQGVIVRPMGPDSIRVTIGLPEENKRFIEALSKVLRGDG